jgi:putative hemolysin
MCAVPVTLTLAAAACGRAPEPSPAPTQAAALPNPASAYCEQQGGRLEIRTDASGGQAGFCLFADGSECEEWAYFRGECSPGAAQAPSAQQPEGWETYTHPTLRYSFLYPDGSALETDDVGRYITVLGPLKNNEHWPSFNVAHPDEEDYHPPADVDLQTWLADHNRLAGEVIGTRTIAGAAAIHTRNDNTQAYDDDRFYFVHDGQVYEITVVHAGQEDWSVYDIFLNSFGF